MNLRFFMLVLIWSLCPGPAQGNPVVTGRSVKFHGTVTSLPCSIAPGSDKILVDFKEVAVNDLYRNKKSSPIPFSIRLIDCTTNVFNSVTVTFSGDESPELANHLAIHALSPGGTAGVGIGLQLQNGSPIELNKASPATRLAVGNMSLGFSAFLAAQPGAQQNREIQYGPFTATASYTLNYQ